MVRALCVLALVLFGFASVPASAAATEAAGPADICGEAIDDDGHAHAPCHACRYGDILLPAAPEATQATRLATAVCHVAIAEAEPRRPASPLASARGPPAA